MLCERLDGRTGILLRKDGRPSKTRLSVLWMKRNYIRILFLTFRQNLQCSILNYPCHFPQVGFHVPGRDELHFLFNERPFFLCYSEFNLYCPFPAVHRLTLLSIPRVWDTSQQAIFNRRAAAQEGENTERVPLSYAC